MSRLPWSAIEETLSTAGRAHGRIIAQQSVSGGCIHRSYRLDLDDGSRVFCKANDRGSAQIFEREAQGLRTLNQASHSHLALSPSATGTHSTDNTRAPRSAFLRAAQPIAVGCTSTIAYLLIEWIEPGVSHARTWFEFGANLARLHQTARNKRFGLEQDNHCGASVQSNRWHDDWLSFWREERLRPQWQAARRRELIGDDQLFDSLLTHLGDILHGHEQDGAGSLVHGDLWSGNVLVDERGEAMLIDPAAYYGHREAEFGMIDWLGNFGSEFQAGYSSVWPLTPGSQRRIACYRLYHELNHLNLFGASYRSSCLATMRSLL